MEKILSKYIGLVLVLCVIWYFLPKQNLPINDMYLFASLGLVIVFIYNNYILPINSKYKSKEHFEQKTKVKKTPKSKEHFNTVGMAAPAPTTTPTTTPTTAPTISPIGTVSYLTPGLVTSGPILTSSAASLTIEQIKSLPQSDKDQLIQAYLLDLYKNTKPSILGTNPYVLTESEIVYYIGLFVSSLDDQTKMQKIRDNITQISKLDSTRGSVLLKLLNLTQINSDLTVKIAGTSPLKLIDIVNAMESSSDLTNFVKSGSSKSIEIDLIKMLQTKISALETAVTNKLTTEKTGIPAALMEILSSNKFVDSKGMIKDIMYGDLKYNSQLTPGQMQPLGSYDSTFNNKWDNAYTILNTDKWRPPFGKPPVCKQEKQCPVCPSLTSGYPLSVMDFDKSRYVMGPDGISTDYINQLNNPYKG